tara:strand:+ start:222 stop:2213 length:1992 start_codon:yes stop_codon:yes gene_type:complete
VQATDPTFTVGTDPIIDITSTGTGLSLGDDQMSGMKNIGFDFTFYDQTFSQVNISMNGFFTFQSNFSVPRSRNYLSETLPATSFNYSVFPAWSDYIRRSSGNQSPYIKTFGQTSDTDQYFVIMWDNVSEYSNGLKSTFQAILYETTNEISFRYDELRIQNHDLTIGLQGNNEAVTYLRYEDTNSTTYSETDDFSLTTAEVVDESFSNLSSECLVDSDYSELCDVYDLSFDVEEDEDYYLQGSGVSDAMLLGYDDEEDFYGFNTEEVYTGTSVFSAVTDSRDGGGTYYDDIGSISYFEYDTRDVIENEDTFDNFDILDFGDYTLDNSEEGTLAFIEIDLDVLPLPDTLPDIRLTEDEFVEFAQHMDEHFDFEDEMDGETWDEQFENFEEPIEEEIEQREELEEQYEEEILEEEEEALDEAIDEISPEEVEEGNPERSERRRQLVRNNINATNRTTSNIVNSSISAGQSSQNVNSGGSSSSAVVSSSGGGVSTSNSPSISAQISAAQVQTNTVLQSIEVIPMPSMDNTPSVAMAEVQVTTMENQIQSVTSSVMTSSEADQIAEEVVASNIRQQQENSQAQQEESGEYDSQGQTNLIAFMNYVPNFNSYSAVTIPDQANWYQPTQIYADAVLRDNGNAYGELVNTSMSTLYDVMQSQPVQLFIDRR